MLTKTADVNYTSTTEEAAVRVLVSYQCGMGSNPRPNISSGLSLLLVLALLRGFLSGFSGFPPSTKINTSKFQFDLETLVDKELP